MWNQEVGESYFCRCVIYIKSDLKAEQETINDLFTVIF